MDGGWLLAGVSVSKHACPLGLGASEARAPGDRACIAQVTHFAGLRVEAGCSIGMALAMQPSVAANRAGPIWHVYPKDARRVARWIFVGCGMAGRGILKDQAK